MGYQRMKNNIMFGVLLGMVLLIGVLIIGSNLIKASEFGNAFLISERTEYGLTTNTIYINVTENLGKDQTINVSSIFQDDFLTNQITYTDFKVYKNLTVDTYGFSNTSLGKYAKTNTTIETIGTGTNQTDVVTNHYYLSNDTELFCDYVLADKSCLIESYGVNGTKIIQDFGDLPSTKEKIILSGLKIENKVGGIVLPKNSMIQLKLTYKHPIANKEPSANVNKYDIIVSSFDGLDKSILDPTWWNTNWEYYKILNIKENSGVNLTNYTTLVVVTYDTSMQVDFDDLRFIAGDNTTELGYWIQNKTDSTTAYVWVNTSLTANVNTTFYMYYGNNAVSTTSNRADVWKSSATDGHGATFSTGATLTNPRGFRVTPKYPLILLGN